MCEVRTGSVLVTLAVIAGVLLLLSLSPSAQANGTLAAGDRVRLTMPQAPGLSGVYTVGDDGRLLLPAVGAVQASGLTMEGLKADLIQRLQAMGYEGTPILDQIGAGVAAEGLLAPADRIQVTVVGEPDITNVYTVQADGTVTLPMGGQIKASGLTPSQLAASIKQALSGYLIEPNITVAVIQGKPETVHIFGQIVAPGAYELSAAPTMLALFAMAHGGTPTADMSKVVLVRKSEQVIVPVETGSGGQAVPVNLPLQAGDVVVVPQVTQASVFVTGAVVTPGPRPLSQAATAAQAVIVAGGLMEGADATGSYVMRGGQRIGVDLAAVMEGGRAGADIPLEAEDVVVVPRISRQVYVTGAITKPGTYQLGTAANILQLWALVQPADPDADLHNVVLLRGSESRVVDLAALLENPSSEQNLSLKPGDGLVVPLRQSKVFVLGAVTKPGVYTFDADETLMDILARAGGPTPTAAANRMMVARRKPGALSEGAGGVPVQAHPINIRDMAIAPLTDPAMRPMHGDVIFVPTRATTKNWTEWLLSVALLFNSGSR